MELKNDKEDKELLHSQAHIWNHIFQFINSMSLKCAVQLDIPDIVNNHGRPMSLSQLVAALPVNPSKSRCVYRLMRVLVHSGFFTREKISETAEEEEGYLLTPASRLLLKDEPLNVRPFLLAVHDPILTKPWHHVSEWFQNDNPTPFDTAHGRTFWDYAGHEPRLNHFFNDAMASDARLVTSVVVKNCKGVFEGLNSLVDVGGGTGVTKFSGSIQSTGIDGRIDGYLCFELLECGCEKMEFGSLPCFRTSLETNNEVDGLWKKNNKMDSIKLQR